LLDIYNEDMTKKPQKSLFTFTEEWLEDCIVSGLDFVTKVIEDNYKVTEDGYKKEKPQMTLLKNLKPGEIFEHNARLYMSISTKHMKNNVFPYWPYWAIDLKSGQPLGFTNFLVKLHPNAEIIAEPDDGDWVCDVCENVYPDDYTNFGTECNMCLECYENRT